LIDFHGLFVFEVVRHFVHFKGYTAHTKHKGTIQPIQNTDCTTGQASLQGGGDGNYTDYLFEN
jgi:hypothetical protein